MPKKSSGRVIGTVIIIYYFLVPNNLRFGVRHVPPSSSMSHFTDIFIILWFRRLYHSNFGWLFSPLAFVRRASTHTSAPNEIRTRVCNGPALQTISIEL